MTIKHIVISGGGPTGIKALGALQYLEKEKYWNIENIESMYCTSAGAIIGLLIALKFDWTTINDYIIKRPWHEAYQIGVNQIFEAYNKKGLFDKKVIDIFYKPFFNSRDISMKMTMREFYEYTKIDFHVFSLEMNRFEIVDVSYNSHPDLELLKAIHMTIALPLVISPCCIGNDCFVDGGMISNYPLNYCIKNNCITDTNGYNEILGLRNNYVKDTDTKNDNGNNNIVNQESTILDYIMTFINKLVLNVDTEKNQPIIENEVLYDTKHTSFSFLKSAVSSSEVRQQLLNDGIEASQQFLSLKQKKESKNEEKNDKEQTNIIHPELLDSSKSLELL
uniref:PNPLA domain-containing protein n=1 Tax=viral metagenome TaxID=1070528 RepID=A0A6C0H8V4_9ZZZZ